MTKTCFNKTTGTFEIAWPERVARHDIVYERAAKADAAKPARKPRAAKAEKAESAE